MTTCCVHIMVAVTHCSLWPLNNFLNKLLILIMLVCMNITWYSVYVCVHDLFHWRLRMSSLWSRSDQHDHMWLPRAKPHKDMHTYQDLLELKHISLRNLLIIVYGLIFYINIPILLYRQCCIPVAISDKFHGDLEILNQISWHWKFIKSYIVYLTSSHG